MSPRRTDPAALVMLMLVMLLWAGNSIVGRAVRFDIPPFFLAWLRWCGALIVVMPFAAAGLWRDRAAIMRGWRPILALGIIGVAGFNAFLYAGLRYTTATNALLLQAAIPTLVVLFDRLFFGIRARSRQMAGVALSTLGVLAIVFQGDPAHLLALHFGFGDALILCAVVAWSIYTVLLKLRPAIAPLSFIAVTFAIGAAAMTPLALAESAEIAAMRWTPGVIGAVLYVALLPSLVAYTIFNAAVARIGAAAAGQTITLMPLFGALLSVALLGEQLAFYHLEGMACILFGIAATFITGRRPQDSAGTAPKPPLERGA